MDNEQKAPHQLSRKSVQAKQRRRTAVMWLTDALAAVKKGDDREAMRAALWAVGALAGLDD